MSVAARAAIARPVAWTAWVALASAGLAWLFDAMDLQIFTLILFPCVSDLIGSTDSGRVAAIGGTIVACKLFAWGIGGIVFGVVADHIGRARTMLVTVLVYSSFTALSGLAQSWPQLAAIQALAGIGMGVRLALGLRRRRGTRANHHPAASFRT
jgi:MFS family permease